jgi:hypothetical protein
MTKYTPARVRTICRHIANGVPREHAAALAGLSKGSYHEWLTSFADFAEAVTRAEGRLIAKRLARIDHAGAAGTWQADAWTLERRLPEHFGRSVAGIYNAGLPEGTQPITRVILEVPPGGSVDDARTLPDPGPGSDPFPAPRPIRRLDE